MKKGETTKWCCTRRRSCHVALVVIVVCYTVACMKPFWMIRDLPNETSDLTNNNNNNNVEGIMVSSKTSPSFKIWLFPPSDDIISRKIKESGTYEPEETIFIQYVASSLQQQGGSGSGAGWAVDIGANIGFHSLHMATLGMKVIAFEPSPDTATLLKRSIDDNRFDDGEKKGSVQIVQAAAAESPGFGRLLRHRESPGMTILQLNGEDSSSLPFGVEEIIADKIPLVRPEESLSHIISTHDDDAANLKLLLLLLKVDAEGHELHAFRGVNLDRFPFRFVTFEFFPELLWKAGQTNPLDLLKFIHSFQYSCATHPNSLKNNQSLLRTSEDFQAWYESTVLPAYKKSTKFHINIYCRKNDVSETS